MHSVKRSTYPHRRNTWRMLSCLPQGTYFHLGCLTKDRALKFILFGLSNFSGLAHEKKRVVLEFQVGLHNTGLHTLGLFSTFIQKYKLAPKTLTLPDMAVSSPSILPTRNKKESCLIPEAAKTEQEPRCSGA